MADIEHDRLAAAAAMYEIGGKDRGDGLTAHEHRMRLALEASRYPAEVQQLREALREIEGMDTPITVEQPKDYQAYLYHRMRKVARNALKASGRAR